MNEPAPTAILIDLDDTILEYDSSADRVWRSVVTEFADGTSGLDVERFMSALHEFRECYWGDPERHRTGRLNLELARREVVSGTFELMGLTAPSLADKIADSYAVQRELAVRPFPGALETLAHIRAKGIRMALVTNGTSAMQRSKIQRFDLEPFFDYVLVEGEFGAGKPDERVYLHAIDRLDARPSESWMVGDNLEWEVAAPQRLGIFSIWVDNNGAGLPEAANVSPDLVIRTLSALMEEI
jgi:putative hydrolase of the HAD superfamily